MSMEHEQLGDKTVALSVKATKLTGRLLAKAMRAFLKKVREPHYKQGEQSVRSLRKQGAALADIEIPSEIGAFKRVAREHKVDFAVKRDDSASPPNWVVFFKAKDSKAIESAFNEYSKIALKYKEKKPSMLDKLAKFKEIAKSAMPLARNRDRGGIEH